jgi:hypothetical protein
MADYAVAELIVEIRLADARSRIELTRGIAAQIRRRGPLPAAVIAEVLGALRAGPAGGNGALAAGPPVAINYHNRSPPELGCWPQPVLELADEVRRLEQRLVIAQRGPDFAGAQVITRQLSATTRRLEQAKLRHLALPDAPSAGRPRMVG